MAPDAARAQLQSALEWIVSIADGASCQPHRVSDPLPTIARIARRALADCKSETAPFTGPDTYRG